MEDIEQVTPEVEETIQPEASAATDEISDIFSNALKDKADSPEVIGQTEEDKPEEQPETEQVIETPYGEITLDEAKKIAFKDEKEFQAFLDKNPFLKEGFLRQSDYTRKTTQVAEERKKFAEEKHQFEELKAKEEQAWGQVKPTEHDREFFQNLWHVYQYGSEPLANQISSFARDISLIAQGKNPVGPLAGQNGQTVDYARDSQVIGVKRELDQLKQDQARKEQEFQAKEREIQIQEAKREVNTWLSEKEKAGVKITPEERQVMALFSGIRDEDGNRISLDEMYRLALAKLGRTEKEAIKKVFTDSKSQSRKTPNQPNSKVPSHAKPEASTIDEIFQQGLERLSSER